MLKRPSFWMILAFTLVFALVPLVRDDANQRETLILIAIAIALASNLNLMIGYTGYVNFGNAVFFGLGGYIGLYLTTVKKWPLTASALAAGIVVTLFALVLGLAILRLRGSYFALATIGVLEAVQAFVTNFNPWGRSSGMYVSMDTYAPLGGPMRAVWTAYLLVVGVMGLSLLLSLFIKNSKFGLGLFAIREDEDAAVVLGVNATLYKARVYAISAFLPAVVGVLVFFKNGMIDPSGAFDLTVSIEAIVMMMLGGQGTVAGAVVGAALYEQLRGYLLTSPSLSSFHLVIAGGLLLIIILFAPEGLIGWLYHLLPKTRKVLE
ncbi:MAG: branched-chain amino acid ABC transporter permease [Candidatus Korobacteraceae bacterium]|jgi:branched-chain amino acid transport system permease protein